MCPNSPFSTISDLFAKHGTMAAMDNKRRKPSKRVTLSRINEVETKSFPLN